MKPSTRNWALYAAAWVPFAVFETIAIQAQEDATLAQAAVSAAFITGVAALAGVVVWRVTGRLALTARPLLFFLLHCALAVGYAVFWTGTQLAWLWLVAGREIATYVAEQGGVWILLTGAVLYVVIAGISYLIRAQRHLRERDVAAARAEALAAQAQLRAIRAQLNPHFLFNSLHSLGGLVRRDPAAAEDAIDRLGELLRYALDHGADNVVRLRDELAFARNYIALEELRLGDRLRCVVTVDDTALDTLVPPFVLQPLVENAIRHGIAPRAGPGTLTIRVASRGSRLTLEVDDDGRGTTSAALERAEGLGLRSLRQQLAARFGNEARLEIESSPDAGFRATVTMPVCLPALEPAFG